MTAHPRAGLELREDLTPRSRADVYRAMTLRAMPRLLGTLDRDACSLTHGSFDRDHWAWKFRDYPVNMLQTGLLPLVLCWTEASPENPYRGNPRVLAWITAALEETLRRQHRNGAFDTVTPFSQDHGATLALVNTVALTLRVAGEALPPSLRERALNAMQRACAFAAESVEDYAFISNHQALFALAWHRAGEQLGDARCRERCAATVDAILANQSADGWYNEYGGPDPGYESLGIFYLASLFSETDDARLAGSLSRSLAFFAHCVHPDGSVGGTYGSRLTRLWYPGGFELLAAADPMASRIATFLVARLAQNNVVTPDNTDAHNLPTLLYTYLVAAAACDRHASDGSQSAVLLPCESGPLLRHYDSSGITVAGTQHYYAVTCGLRGGVLTVCDRHSGKMVFEDSGIAITAQGRIWSTSAPASVARQGLDQTTRKTHSSVRVGASGNLPITPAKFLLLRLLSLTAFRSVGVGRLLRRLIVERLITRRETGPFISERVIEFGDDFIVLQDRLSADRGVAADDVAMTRSYQPFHMGSARYFHFRDLRSIPVVDELLGGLTARSEGHRPEWRARWQLRWGRDGGAVTARLDDAEPRISS